jgi:ankyrin repeat protein
MKNQSKQLLLEIQNGNWDAVSELIGQGVDPCCLNPEELNAFDILLNSVGYDEAYQKVCQDKIFSKDKSNIQNELDGLLRAIAKKEVYLPISIFSENGKKPFEWPYFIFYIQKLFKAGADPNSADNNGHTAFSIAARNSSSCYDVTTQSHQRFFLLMFKTLYHENKTNHKVPVSKWGSLFAKKSQPLIKDKESQPGLQTGKTSSV